MVLSITTGDAQHAVEHMAHQLVLTSTTKVYDNYSQQSSNDTTCKLRYCSKHRVTVCIVMWVYSYVENVLLFLGPK